jgi:replicative DNA helicase
VSELKDIFQPEAEMAVLNIILRNPQLMSDLHIVQTHMFSSTPNQLLFQTIKDLCEEQKTPDINLIYSKLKESGRDVIIGGKDYLNSIYRNDGYSSENLLAFESLVINAYKAQNLLTLSRDLPSMLVDNGTVDETIAKVKSKLDALSSVSGSDSTANFDAVLRETWDYIVSKVNSPGISGITTGIRNLDLNTNGLEPGKLWIVAGRPGSGKTSLLLNMALSGAKQGFGSLVFSLEMNKKQLGHRLVTIATGISGDKIRFGTLTEKELDIISDTIKQIKSYPIYIESNPMVRPNEVWNILKKYTRDYGVKEVYLDYLQLLIPRGNDATHEIGNITRMGKLLANDLGVTNIFASQFNRLVELRDDKRPILSDLRQSGNIEEDADAVVGLYRDYLYNSKTKDPNLMELLILKQREGATGTILAQYIAETYKITDYIK